MLVEPQPAVQLVREHELVVAPGAAALNLAGRLAVALPLAAGLAALAGAAGLLISYHLDVAAGATVALVAVAVYAASLLRARPLTP